MALEFKAWPKIPRYGKNNILVTEKIDGTNACIAIGSNGEFMTQSRTRIITPEDDNFGFSKWAYENKEELLKLGHGYHYGEWYGCGIQRGYNLTEKRFALFNTIRPRETLPACVDQVPILYTGIFSDTILEELASNLQTTGSRVSSGYMNVEGMIIYHYNSKVFEKWIINK